MVDRPRIPSDRPDPGKYDTPNEISYVFSDEPMWPDIDPDAYTPIGHIADESDGDATSGDSEALVQADSAPNVFQLRPGDGYLAGVGEEESPPQPDWRDLFVVLGDEKVGVNKHLEVAGTQRALADQRLLRLESLDDDPEHDADIMTADFERPHLAEGDLEGDQADDNVLILDFFPPPTRGDTYPDELVYLTDFLMEGVGGDVGTEAAHYVANEYNRTGMVPNELPNDLGAKVERALTQPREERGLE